MSFIDRLATRAIAIDSPLCVGLDPRVEPGTDGAGERIVSLNRRIVEATRDRALCYKPNIAFYEQHGAEGIDALLRTIALIPDDVPVILDAKRGDIGATAEAYASACLALGADAVTVSPYMGRDSVEPFTRAGLAVFVLCRTSNPGGAELQLLPVGGGSPAPAPGELYLRVASAVAGWSGEIGLVVAGNDPQALRAVRAARPDAWFLAPGIGAQGGTMRAAVEAGLRADGLGLLPVVARGVANADDPTAAARSFVEEYRRARDAAMAGPTVGRAHGSAARPAAEAAGSSAAVSDLLDAILDTGCFRVGTFTLKSGIVSPFYLDLRRLQSDPAALEIAAAVYASMIDRLDAPADRIAAIPVAAVPLATALALRSRLPLIYPRLPAKPHGTGNRIEGAWRAGERALLVDDLITTGLSKMEAIAVLREEGLVVEDLLVLVERGGAGGREPGGGRNSAGGREGAGHAAAGRVTDGRAELEAVGVRVHAAVDVRDLVTRAGERGIVSGEDRHRVETFLAGDS